MQSPHVQPNRYVEPPYNPSARPVHKANPIQPQRDLEPQVPPESYHRGQRKGPRIGDLMNTRVVTATPEMTVRELADLLRRHQVSGVPVVRKDNHELVGVVSQADVAALVSQQAPVDNSAGFYQTIFLDVEQIPLPGCSTTVEDIMTPFIYFATEDSSLAEVMDLMLDNSIHRVVITREKHLVGVVTTTDLLAHFRTQL